MARTCNVENMIKLVEALESGDYKQTSRQLRLDDSDGSQFCCLGVACDLAAIAGVGQWNGETFRDNADEGERDNASSGAWLTDGAAAWLGLSASEGDPDVLTLNTNYSAMNMNDSGYSFAEIAAAIRRDYLS